MLAIAVVASQPGTALGASTGTTAMLLSGISLVLVVLLWNRAREPRIRYALGVAAIALVITMTIALLGVGANGL
jgi:hypothetical protein